MDALWDVLALRAGYNTAVVLVGVTLLGAAGGVVGVFSLLRKRALISDAISHATLPGIALGFLVGLALTGSGRNLALLIAGAALSGAFGVVVVHWIRDRTRLTEDTAIGTVLSVFFGLGIVLLSHIQTLDTAGQAGINYLLLGSTAAMNLSEAVFIGAAAAVLILVTLALLKEFALVAFDAEFGAVQGWPTGRIDLAITLLLLAVVAIGLKTVGMILIIALVIIPPVAARFWTDRLGRMVAISAGFGALSGYLGAAASALLPDLPAGAVIVMTAGALFLVSLLFAPARGVLFSFARHLRYRLRLAERQGLLHAARGAAPGDRLQRAVLRARGFLDRAGKVTGPGTRAAVDVAREQALWDQYAAETPEAAFATPGWPLRPLAEALPADAIEGLAARARAAGRTGAG